MNPSMAAAHRKTFVAAMAAGGGGVAIFRTGPEKVRNRDVHFPFRPDSDFWYLTAFPEPDAVAVLIAAPDGEDNGAASSDRFVLFVRPKDPEMETWHGRRAGIDGATALYGADEAHSIDDLDAELPKLLRGAARLFYRTGDAGSEDFDRKLLSSLQQMYARTRDGVTGPATIVEPGTLLHEQRLVKTADEIAVLRRASVITVEGHRAVAAALNPGMYEYELEATVNGVFRRRGGWGPGYPSIVAGGDNATILHYTENDQPIADGALLLVDAGCEVDGYTADVTRCYPASGRFTDAQKALYEVVLEAELRGIGRVAPGNTFHSVHEEARRALIEGMLAIGLLTGSLDEVLEGGADQRFFMHKTSHWLGIDVHDVGKYWTDGAEADKTSRPLQAGMVLTVEPGLYIAADDETAPEEFRGIGIRIEDDVLVTADGHEVLTGDAPKTIADVEAACAAGAGAR